MNFRIGVLPVFRWKSHLSMRLQLKNSAIPCKFFLSRPGVVQFHVRVCFVKTRCASKDVLKELKDGKVPHSNLIVVRTAQLVLHLLKLFLLIRPGWHRPKVSKATLIRRGNLWKTHFLENSVEAIQMENHKVRP